MAWVNADGLYIKFGKEQGAVGKGGTYESDGPTQTTEVKLDLAVDATATIGQIVGTTGVSAGAAGTLIPGGVRIESVEVVAEVAAVGATATLDVGLVRLDRTTELDFNGLVAALPVASMDLAGERTFLTAGVATAGALVGTTTAFPGYITANRNTANFTAGKVIVRINWYRPQTIG